MRFYAGSSHIMLAGQLQWHKNAGAVGDMTWPIRVELLVVRPPGARSKGKVGPANAKPTRFAVGVKAREAHGPETNAIAIVLAATGSKSRERHGLAATSPTLKPGGTKTKLRSGPATRAVALASPASKTKARAATAARSASLAVAGSKSRAKQGATNIIASLVVASTGSKSRERHGIPKASPIIAFSGSDSRSRSGPMLLASLITSITSATPPKAYAAIIQAGLMAVAEIKKQ